MKNREYTWSTILVVPTKPGVDSDAELKESGLLASLACNGFF